MLRGRLISAVWNQNSRQRGRHAVCNFEGTPSDNSYSFIWCWGMLLYIEICFRDTSCPSNREYLFQKNWDSNKLVCWIHIFSVYFDVGKWLILISLVFEQLTDSYNVSINNTRAAESINCDGLSLIAKNCDKHVTKGKAQPTTTQLFLSEICTDYKIIKR